ncbi:MAG: CPBP family intramembrane metalloprotease [Pseudobutyrivibrio sp.]|nr:CPBP family intramembrane metalloprotease [Pseudobutyrivibrio sp.]
MNQKIADRRKYLPWVFLPCVLAIVIQFAAEVMSIQGSVVLALGSFKGQSFTDLMTDVYNLLISTMTDVAYIVYSVVGIVVFGYIYKRLFKDDAKFTFRGITTNVPATVGGAVLFCIGMQYVTLYLVNVLAATFPSWMEAYNAMMDLSGLDGYISPILALYAMFLGPICEELIFRGITFSAAGKIMPYYMAILIQALLFGAFHMNAIQGSYAFVIGLGLGYIMYLYNNILLTMVLHIAYNFIGIICTAFLPAGGDTIISFFVWTLGSLIVTYISILMLRIGAPNTKVNNNSADI